jgi:dTDP-4-amino-4,6-dideoxygalactose transaminase
VHLSESESAALTASELKNHGVNTRGWWLNGAHAHPATAGYPRAELPVTESLAEHTLGLPFFVDLTTEDIQRIVGALAFASRPRVRT